MKRSEMTRRSIFLPDRLWGEYVAISSKTSRSTADFIREAMSDYLVSLERKISKTEIQPGITEPTTGGPHPDTVQTQTTGIKPTVLAGAPFTLSTKDFEPPQPTRLYAGH